MKLVPVFLLSLLAICGASYPVIDHLDSEQLGDRPSSPSPNLTPFEQLSMACRNGQWDEVHRLMADPSFDPQADHEAAVKVIARYGDEDLLRELLRDPRVNAWSLEMYHRLKLTGRELEPAQILSAYQIASVGVERSLRNVIECGEVKAILTCERLDTLCSRASRFKDVMQYVVQLKLEHYGVTQAPPVLFWLVTELNPPTAKVPIVIAAYEGFKELFAVQQHLWPHSHLLDVVRLVLSEIE